MSELRLVETMEGVCERLLQYSVHKVCLWKSSKVLMSWISIILESLHRMNHKISSWIFAFQERTDHTRFARGTSQTFQALEGLVDKGVKVDIGIPKELWHKPSAEVSHLKTQVKKSSFHSHYFLWLNRIFTNECIENLEYFDFLLTNRA